MPRTRDDARLSLPLLVAITAVPSVSVNIFMPSMPGLVSAFSTDLKTVYFALTFYLAGLAAGQLAYGPLSDRFGRQLLLLIGLALYCAGSGLCAAASDIAIFLAGRVLQAIGGCSGLVLGRAMVHDVHGPGRAASVIGYTVMVTTVLTGLSPAAGGLLDTNFGWYAVFVALTILGTAVLVAAVVWAPETLHRAAAPARQPMLLSAYPRLLTDRRFLRLSVYSALLFASFYSFVAGVPIVMIDLWGHSALAFSAWWTIGSLAYILGNYLAGRYSQAFGVERMLRFGEPLIGGGAVLLLILLALGPQHPLAVFVPIGIIFTGSGIAQPNAISGAINVDVDVVGSASALLGCMQILFGIVAVTLLGALRLDTTAYFSVICSGALLLAIIVDRLLRSGEPETASD